MLLNLMRLIHQSIERTDGKAGGQKTDNWRSDKLTAFRTGVLKRDNMLFVTKYFSLAKTS